MLFVFERMRELFEFYVYTRAHTHWRATNENWSRLDRNWNACTRLLHPACARGARNERVSVGGQGVRPSHAQVARKPAIFTSPLLFVHAWVCAQLQSEICLRSLLSDLSFHCVGLVFFFFLMQWMVGGIQSPWKNLFVARRDGIFCLAENEESVKHTVHSFSLCRPRIQSEHAGFCERCQSD